MHITFVFIVEALFYGPEYAIQKTEKRAILWKHLPT